MARPKTALIVDDEAHVRTFLRLILRELGIETTWEASDGNQALTLAAARKPEFVLLDLNMPILGGADVLKELQQRLPEVPVVVITSENAMKSVLDTVRLGAAGYILKQSPRAEIVERLGGLLEELAADEPAAE